MLVCPQCQFENPDENRFCQKCGTSLADKACPNCSTLVSFEAEQCPNCGVDTGVVWRAIVSFQPPAQSVTSSSDAPSGLIPLGAFLDSQQRYKLLEPLLPPIDVGEVEIRLLDCKPFQASLGESFDRQQLDHPEWETPEAAIEALAIPALVLTYLELQHLSPTLPQLHDAWEDGERQILLLQDRSEMPQLLEEWNSEQVLPLQVLHWLHETTELWATLQPHHCAQSLLQLDNLRVDEDQLLCLQRLYSSAPLELRDLGRLWQQLFQRSQRTQIGSLAQLCQELESGEITALDQLQHRLETIANEFQSQPPTLMAPAPDLLGYNPPVDPAISSAVSPIEEPALPVPQPAMSDQDLPYALGRASLDAPADIPSDIDVSHYPNVEVGEPDEETGESDDTPTVVLPMKLIGVEDAGRTDIGRQRERNEDYYSIATDIKKLETPSGRSLQAKGLYILCDGMGGHAGGEVASALAVETLRKYFETHWQDQLPKEDSIREAIRLANQAIYDLNQQNGQSGSGRMGTTLVLVLVHNAETAIAHVGDSRLYRFSRRRGLEQVTTDHEVGQREIQRGVEPSIAYARPDAYQLTQALGPRDEHFINPDVEFLELNEDMLLLLCSDGLTDNDLLETHWRTHLEPLLNPQASLELGTSQLIELANQYNGHDNITTVLVRVKVRPNLEMMKQR